MQGLASRAYGDVQTRTAADQDIEYAIFEQITGALETVAETEGITKREIVDAVNRNNQLWTTLAADLLSPENALPDETKRNLLTLAEFTRRTGMQVLAGEGDIADLIDVNKTIMAGMKPAA